MTSGYEMAMLRATQDQARAMQQLAERLPRLTEAILAVAVLLAQNDNARTVASDVAARVVASTINEIQDVMATWAPPPDSFRSEDLARVSGVIYARPHRSRLVHLRTTSTDFPRGQRAAVCGATPQMWVAWWPVEPPPESGPLCGECLHRRGRSMT
jgi:hypothetical protein